MTSIINNNANISDFQNNTIDQSEDQCISIVEKDGWALSFVHAKTLKICMAAVKNNGLTILNIEEPTEELCIAAVQQNGMALKMISAKNQTLDIVIAAVRQNRNAIRYVIPRFINDLVINL